MINMHIHNASALLHGRFADFESQYSEVFTGDCANNAKKNCSFPGRGRCYVASQDSRSVRKRRQKRWLRAFS